MQQANSKRSLRRQLTDKGVAQIIRFFGLSVIFAVVLIFLYLLYKTLPLFASTEIVNNEQLGLNAYDTNVHLNYGVDEYSNILYALKKTGEIQYWNLVNRKNTIDSHYLDVKNIVDFSRYQPSPDAFAVLTENSQVFLIEHDFEVNYPNNQRIITPNLKLPWGDFKINLTPPIHKIALRQNDDNIILASAANQDINIQFYNKEQGLFDDQITLEFAKENKISVNHKIDYLMLNSDMRWVIAISKSGNISYIPTFKANPQLWIQQTRIETNITEATWLLGDISLLLGTEKGTIEQWFPVKPENAKISQWQKIRSYSLTNSPIEKITSEYQRKLFAVSDTQGNIALYYSSSGKRLLTDAYSNKAIKQLFFNIPGTELFTLDAENVWSKIKLKSEHPESNFNQLWGKIHYESYQKPEYIWQSSAATQDFEPKFSLSPLLFGTIKGAIYAMLFAIPFAIFGAIYTAFFMSNRLRRTIKPAIETMEALPTVILGFLAGLWMAPFVESNLMLLFVMLFTLPVGIFLFGYLSHLLSNNNFSFIKIENRAITIIPVLLLLTLLSSIIADPLQNLLFNGDLRLYISHDLGISYNQRNALVVGFAMGFAVIPTIFSITEDAVYSVPRHLTNGSLAMGASPWQTLVGVVLPTASPGIFSAVMIGFGRAVGETMIVLMATGNTPVMEFNIFEGMRTLSANIAVEMPESEVDGTHFRILFLAAFVLFCFTFFFNTIAESIRHRLKKKYAEL